MTTTEWYKPEPSPEATQPYEYWEKFGALFNAFTPLVSIMGFAAVLFSIFHQESIARKELERQEAQSNVRMYIDMILAFFKFHGDLKTDRSAQEFINIANKNIDWQLSDKSEFDIDLHNELMKFVSAWKNSYCQLGSLVGCINEDSLLEGTDKPELLKTYITNNIGIEDSLIFSTLAFALKDNDFIRIMNEVGLTDKEADLVDEWVTYYGYFGRHICMDKVPVKAAIKRFIYSIFPADDERKANSHAHSRTPGTSPAPAPAHAHAPAQEEKRTEEEIEREGE